MTSVRAGKQLRSTVCSTQVVVVRGAEGDVDLRCGGEPMVEKDSTEGAGAGAVPEGSEGTSLGKRYVDEQAGIELLCAKAGAGDLTCDGRRMVLKSAKPLPSSD